MPKDPRIRHHDPLYDSATWFERVVIDLSPCHAAATLLCHDGAQGVSLCGTHAMFYLERAGGSRYAVTRVESRTDCAWTPELIGLTRKQGR